MTLHVRDLAVEFEAADDTAPVVVAGLVEWMERRLAEEAALGRIGGFSVHVVRDVAKEAAESSGEITHHLCCMCGTVSLASDWTYWQQNMDEATEAETPWVPSKHGETDPMARCPVCKWEHRDTDDGSGYYMGTLNEMEEQREKDEHEYAEWWALQLAEAQA